MEMHLQILCSVHLYTDLTVQCRNQVLFHCVVALLCSNHYIAELLLMEASGDTYFLDALFML